MYRLLLALVLFLLPTVTLAQSMPLDRYIREGLSNNLALKQRDFSLQKSLKALGEAKGLFLPSISFEARYSRAGGGREIIIPIGDLMNPVYGTLNELLVAQGLPPRPFPTLQNEIVPFLREEEQETKVRLVQPVFQPAIYYNYKIKKNLARVQEEERNVYRRQLVADIKTAYFNYLKTIRIIDLYASTRELLEENLRVSRSLFGAEKATREVVFRAEAELSALEQKEAEAERDRKLAASYFNFLLNRPPNEVIEATGDDAGPPEEIMSYEEAERIALTRREELFQVEGALEVARHNVRLAGSRYLPSVNFVLDYGIQGEFYRFSERDDFWMGSVLLSWSIFDGFQRKAKRDQAVLERKTLEALREELGSRIVLQVREAFDNLAVARRAIVSAGARVSSAEKSFEIVRRKYTQGMSPHIEFLDARNTLTNAEISLVLAGYDYRVRYAEFERVLALNDFGE
ncbi:MAG: TolC family protein [bacterium]|nr:MAG: TolC family protein [bacterium]